MVGLESVAGRRGGTASLGMAQQLGIAAALLGDPGVLLFDEPVNGLDPEESAGVRNLMRSLAAEGRTVFVSSHLISEMAVTADRLIVIARGQLLADTTVAELAARVPVRRGRRRGHRRLHHRAPARAQDRARGSRGRANG